MEKKKALEFGREEVNGIFEALWQAKVYNKDKWCVVVVTDLRRRF